MDANVLIGAELEPAPPKFWEMLSTLAREQRLFAPQAVYDEVLARLRATDSSPNHQGEVKRPMSKGVAWAKECKNIFIEDTTLLPRVIEIQEKNQTLVPASRRDSSADPWLIALAEQNRLTVVAADKKVLKVCKNMGIPCCDVKKFLSQEGDEELANLSYP